MTQGNNVTVETGQVTRRRGYWYKLSRCSICLRLLWLRLVMLSEPVGVPEPLRHWILCQHCYQALLGELSRSSIRSPLRLRIAIGLVAAERSPAAYSAPARPKTSEQEAFQKEFAVFTWLMILFALMHMVIFAIIFTVR
jgi:hypothetical protein